MTKQLICSIETDDEYGFDLLTRIAKELSNEKEEFLIEQQPRGWALFRHDIELDETIAWCEANDRAYAQWKDK